MIHLYCSAAKVEGDLIATCGDHLVDAVAGPRMVITVQELVDENLLIGFDEQCKNIDLISQKQEITNR